MPATHLQKNSLDDAFWPAMLKAYVVVVVVLFVRVLVAYCRLRVICALRTAMNGTSSCITYSSMLVYVVSTWLRGVSGVEIFRLK